MIGVLPWMLGTTTALMSCKGHQFWPKAWLLPYQIAII